MLQTNPFVSLRYPQKSLKQVLRRVLVQEEGISINNLRSKYISSSVDFESFTTLHLAVSCGRIDIIRSILKNYREDVDKPASGGLKPIHMIVHTPNPTQCLEELIRFNVDINGREIRGNTLLPFINHLFDAKRVAELLNFKFDVNAVNIMGNNCLHIIAMSLLDQEKTLEIAKVYLKKGTNLNTKNSNSQTPLHIAVEYATESLVELFLRYDADLDLRDGNGQTPLEVACNGRKSNIINLITRYAALRKHRGCVSENTIMNIWINGQIYNLKSFNDELENFKRILLEETNVSYYDILFSDMSNLSERIRARHIGELENSTVVKNSEFGPIMVERLQMAHKMRDDEFVLRNKLNVLTYNRYATETVNRVAGLLQRVHISNEDPIITV